MNQQLTKAQEEQLWIERATIAREDNWYFLKYFTFTKDEHDPTTIAKPFPEKAVYRIIARVYDESDVLFVEKSRQIMMTWIMSTLFLHDAMFKKSRRLGNQSKKQEDADGILSRQRHVYEQAKYFEDFFKPSGGFPQAKMTGDKVGTTSNLEFIGNKSEIISIPQGGDVVNSHTWSGLFADEINLQSEAEDGYSNAMPALDRGGKWVGQGTPNGKQFAYYVMHNIDPNTRKIKGKNRVDSRRVDDKVLTPPEELTDEQKRYWIEDRIVKMTDEDFKSIPLHELIACMPGMRYWLNCDGIACLRVHYTSDPDKDPVTATGKEWYDKERPKYSNSQWERQFEINYDTFEGRPVITNWQRPLFVTNPEYDSNLPLILSFDFGTNVCGCIFGHYAPISGFNARQIQWIDEIILERSNTVDLATRTVEKLQTQYFRSWHNKNIRSYCDPAGHQTRETTSDLSQNTSIKILQTHGIYPTAKKFGVKESTEILETVFAIILPDGKPMVAINERCTYLISCFAGGLHFPNKGGPEGHYEKDDVYDHGGDMSRYFIGNVCDQFDLSQKTKPRGDVNRFRRRKYTGEIIGLRSPNARARLRGHHVR